MLGERLALEQAGNLGGQPDTPFSPLWGQVWESQGPPPPYHIMLSQSKTLAPVAHGLSFPQQSDGLGRGQDLSDAVW